MQAAKKFSIRAPDNIPNKPRGSRPGLTCTERMKVPHTRPERSLSADQRPCSHRKTGSREQPVAPRRRTAPPAAQYGRRTTQHKQKSNYQDFTTRKICCNEQILSIFNSSRYNIQLITLIVFCNPNLFFYPIPFFIIFIFYFSSLITKTQHITIT